MKQKLERWLLAIAFGFLLLGSAGCVTTDEDNLTERPWNAPKTWETGMPSGLMNGR
jgi:hypothetical protein